jgi:hypothetical protein
MGVDVDARRDRTNPSKARPTMATDRQIAANRANAQLSRGPTSEAGKDRSRRNAFKHGMAAESVPVAEAFAEEAAFRRERWADELRPASELAALALDRAVAASIRIDLCENTFDGLVVDQTTRARLNWDADRALEAEALGLKIRRQPALVARQLAATKHGADWLIEAWSRLGELLEDGRDWDEAQASIALDMLGVPLQHRDGRSPLDPAPGVSPASHRLAIVRREVERLRQAKRISLDELDELANAQARAALLVVLTKPAALIMRYENEAWRRFRRSIEEAKQTGDPAEAPPRPSARPLTEPTRREPVSAAPAPDRTLSESAASLNAQLAAAEARMRRASEERLRVDLAEDRAPAAGPMGGPRQPETTPAAVEPTREERRRRPDPQARARAHRRAQG